MSEMEMVAEHLIIIGKGTILADTSMADFIAAARHDAATVVTPEAAALAILATKRGASIEMRGTETVHVLGMTSADIGELAMTHGIVLHELVPDSPSLEEAFMALTRESVEYHGHQSSEGAAA
jgi:ABC-2 type transport system ATP-binding protein